MPDVLDKTETAPTRTDERPGALAGFAKGAVTSIVVMALFGAGVVGVPIPPYALLALGLVVALVWGGRDATAAHRAGIVAGFLGTIALAVAIFIVAFDDWL